MHYNAANILFDEPQLVYSAGILSHHAIELTLKGCIIWDKLRYRKIHNLLRLANDVSFIELSNMQQKNLEAINDFYLNRYGDFKTLEQAQQGTFNKAIVESFYDFMIQSLPEDLRGIYDSIKKNSKI